MNIEKSFKNKQVLLQMTLEFMVPLQILEYQKSGTLPSQEEIQKIAQTIGEHGDALMFRTKHTTETLSAMVRGVAAMAFCPGGVTTFSSHFEAKMPDSCTE